MTDRQRENLIRKAERTLRDMDALAEVSTHFCYEKFPDILVRQDQLNKMLDNWDHARLPVQSVKEMLERKQI